MGMKSSELKRKFRYQTACVNGKTLAIISAVFAVVCIITSVANVKSSVYKKFITPKFSLSPFFCILFWVIFSALFGAAFAVILSSPARNKKTKTQALVLAACAFVLCNAWIVLVYSAASFLIAALVAAVAMACCAVVFSLYSKMNKLAAIMVFVFAVWLVYALYFSMALAFLS